MLKTIVTFSMHFITIQTLYYTYVLGQKLALCCAITYKKNTVLSCFKDRQTHRQTDRRIAALFNALYGRE